MARESGRQAFSSKLGFILTCAGASVGLGNIWRFPILAAKYGGAAFIFVYVVLAITLGLILVITEMAVGRKTGKSLMGIFFEYAGKHRWVGVLCVVATLFLLSYYLVVGGWVTKYFAMFVSGNGLELIGDYFSNFADFKMEGILNNPIIWFAIFLFLSVLVVGFRIDKGLERVNKVLMPILFVLMIIIAIYVLTMDNIGEGVAFYIVPKFENITVDTFLAAMGQIFYSLSLAMGILVVFGSYTKKETDLEKSALYVCILDSIVSFLAGLIIIPVVYVSTGGIGEPGPGLMFEVLPQVFSGMNNGQLIGTLFFLLVFFAAITSSIALAESAVASIDDVSDFGRRKCIGIVTVFITIIGLLCCMSTGPLGWIVLFGNHLMDIIDTVVSSLMLPFIEIALCVLLIYVIKLPTVLEEITISSNFRFGKYYEPFIKFVATPYIVLILVIGIVDVLEMFGSSFGF